MSRVLLVNMPFSNLRWPNLGPSLLKAALLRRDIACDLAYFNFDLAERIGQERYDWIADNFAFVLGGERLFAKHYFGDQLPDDDAYFREVLQTTDAGIDESDFRDYLEVGQHVEPFLERCMAAIDWADYPIVGFAASFQQTMPSICLARRIKQLHGETTVLFGGAACEAEMGVELVRQFSEIDYAFLGEADLTFPDVVEQILEGGDIELPPGVVGKVDQPTETPDASQLTVDDLDALPYPDFDDFFQRHAASSLRDDIEPLLFFETSRGCWWGQKHHCKFCGLNGCSLTYRSKTPQRAFDELQYLVDRYGVHRACSSDNILDPRYFDTLLPMLRDADMDLAFVFEMKTNLRRAHVQALLDAGLGAAQLGIETFITPVLKLIGKGANALQNLQTLKWFSEADIEVKWNILYGFPGEDPADYAALAELLPSIYHLAPPLAVGPVRLDRFSPYFEDPEAYGMKDPRPNRAFGYVYPFSEDALRQMAYYYEYDYADGRKVLDYAEPMLRAAETWRQLNRTVTLRSFDRADGVLILTDTRPDATVFQQRLTGIQRAVYLFCDSGHTLHKIAEHVADITEGSPPDETTLLRMLDEWIDSRIMVHLDNRYLSLALRARL